MLFKQIGAFGFKKSWQLAGLWLLLLTFIAVVSVPRDALSVVIQEGEPNNEKEQAMTIQPGDIIEATFSRKQVTAQARAEMEWDTHRWGSDYGSIVLPRDDPGLCRDACDNDPKCKAWTYVKPNVQGPQPRCWLTSVARQPTPNTCCVSGVKTSTEPPRVAPPPPPIPAARIYDVITARDVAWGQPVGPSGVFSPDVNPIYVWFRHQGLAAGTTITSVWYFLSTAAPTKIGEGSVTVTPSSDWSQFNFELAQGKRWPVGDYRVELLVSGTPVGEGRFQVATSPATSVVATPAPTPGGVGGLAPEASQPVGVNLTGTWNCDVGGKFYIRQVGNNVWWYGENAPTSPVWSNVAHGVLVGNELRLEWADVPKGRNMNNGNLVLKVESNSRMVAISKTGGFGCSVWTK